MTLCPTPGARSSERLPADVLSRPSDLAVFEKELGAWKKEKENPIVWLWTLSDTALASVLMFM